MEIQQINKAIAQLDRFIEHPEKWNSPTILRDGHGESSGVSGMISSELIAAAVNERERLTTIREGALRK